MKKLLLMTAVLMMAASAMAQDVYVAGHNADGAVLYKNGTALYTSATYNSYPRVGTSITMNPATEDVYWTVDCYSQSSTSFYNDEKVWTDVYKNGTVYFSSGAYKNRVNHVEWVAISGYGENLYSYGSVSTGDGQIRTACVYKDNSTTPYLTLGNGNYDSEAFSGMFFKTSPGVYYTYSCGYQKNSSGTKEAKVWKGSSVLYSLGTGVAYDMDFYRGDVYTLVVAGENSAGAVKVYNNDNLLYTLESSSGFGFDIDVFGGDVYVSGWGAAGNRVIWKNGTALYTNNSGDTKLGCMSASTDGIYSVVRDGSVIYKNGTSTGISLSGCTRANDILVNGACADENVRTLPYHEGFEISNSDWNCWTTIDVDGVDNMGYSTWFVRGNGNGASEGSHWASHGLNSTSQEGWLISPQLFLQYGRDETTLTFKSRNFNGDGCGVYISTTNNSTSSFTKLEDIAQSTSWESVGINLDDYQGYAVYIAFKYAGGSNNWDIDDINVTEGWSSCGVFDLPYTFDFEDEYATGTCWYLIDSDHSGDQKCWHFEDGALMHNYGQYEGVQQVGDALSPRFQLEANKTYALVFKSKNQFTGDDRKNRIWLGIDVSGTPYISQYSTKIWEDDTFPSDWTEITIPLPESVAGHTVSFDFEYRGTWAHNWWIDDVTVIEVTDGVEENEEVVLTVVPNPAKDVIYVNGLDDNEEVTIYNTLGQVVKTARLSDGQSLSVSDLSAGVYVLRSENSAKAVKFTVQ